ncbi:MAG: hypothetical protein EBY02_02290, partial [Burkholderiaceae bacterium]|nr:hypothetical protein [Burkholderiaceae bacterium]
PAVGKITSGRVLLVHAISQMHCAICVNASWFGVMECVCMNTVGLVMRSIELEGVFRHESRLIDNIGFGIAL